MAGAPQTPARLALLQLLLLLPAPGWAQPDAEEDVGYNLLFKTASEEFAERCAKTPRALPSWLKGDFVIPSVGQFEMGERHFVGFGDAFGKLHRFGISESSVCGTYRMLETAFWNQSVREKTIAPGLLFYETEPPRHCPAWNPICNLQGGNDNTFVNTIRHGDRLLSLTDSPMMLDIDPVTLGVVGKHAWKDSLSGNVLTGHMDYTGSAHPMHHPSTGQWLDFVANGNALSKHATVKLFTLDEANLERRTRLTDVEMDSPPYMHSFGITQKYIVLPRMPVEFDASNLIGVATNKKPMSQLFQELNLTGPSASNGFFLVPLDGGRPLVRPLPAEEKLFYTHVVNAYDDAEGDAVVIDIATSPVNAFAGDLTIKTATTKAARDGGSGAPRFTVRRFTIPLREGALASSRPVSAVGASTDFTRINPNFEGRRHCFFWGVTWYADRKTQAAMGIAKYDVCAGGSGAAGHSRMWSRRHWYPSEAAVVPSPRPGAAEDDAVLVFTALDGARDETYLMLVDARSMESIAEVGPFPRIGWTTHGTFYPATGTAPAGAASAGRAAAEAVPQEAVLLV